MSMTTELLNGTCTIMPGGGRPENRVNELLARIEESVSALRGELGGDHEL